MRAGLVILSCGWLAAPTGSALAATTAEAAAAPTPSASAAAQAAPSASTPIAAPASAPAAALPEGPLPPEAPAAGLPVTPLPPLADPDPLLDDRLVSWQLRIDSSDEVARLLLRYLDLARYQRMGRSEPITRGELLRLRQTTPGQVRSLLETLGYFDPHISVDLRPLTPERRSELARLTALLRGHLLGDDDGAEAGQPRSGSPEATPPSAADLAEDDESRRQVEVVVSVTPGPRTQIETVRIDFEGPLELAAVSAERDGEATQSAQALMATVRNRFGLPAGAAFSQEAWTDAKAAALAQLRAEGYAAATLAGSQAEIDAPRHQARLVLVIDSGPRFRYGPIHFEGLAHVDESSPRALLTFASGEPLREQPVLDYQDRLSKSGLFESLAVNIDPAALSAAEREASESPAVPVVVKLRERPMHQLTLGAGYSDATGPRVTAEHLHQNILGLDWQAKTKLQLGRDASLAALDLTSHPQPGPYRNLASASLDDSVTSGLRVISHKLRLGRSRDGERIERLYYVEYLNAATTPVGGGTRDNNSSLAYTQQWVLRDLDNPVLPTRGFAVSADASAGRSFHTEADSGWFGRATTRLTGYWPLGESWYGQARLQAGQVFAKPTVSVPFTLLFRAGGDESVRGYAYQSLGPTDVNGTAVGGRVLGTASLELARPIARDIPSVWAATFVDAGNAAPSWQSYSPAVGWGLGIRWRSPVGPLRIDLAYGEQVRRVRLHFSVGITF